MSQAVALVGMVNWLQWRILWMWAMSYTSLMIAFAETLPNLEVCLRCINRFVPHGFIMT